MTLTPQEQEAMAVADKYPDEHFAVCGCDIEYNDCSPKAATALTALVRRLLEREKVLTSPETIERLAAIEHERWSGWMRHLFNKSIKGINAQGEIVEAVIPEWACRRWMRQMDTPYADLTEEEKESDRAEVRKTLAALSALNPGEKK